MKLSAAGPLQRIRGRGGLSRGGFVRADCELSICTLCVDSTCSPIQSPSQGAVLDEFISGALGGRGRVCSPPPHIHGSVRRRHCRVMVTHTSPNDQSWVYPEHKRFTLCSQFFGVKLMEDAVFLQSIWYSGKTETRAAQLI